MEYRNRAKNRRLKRILTNTIEGFKFKWLHLRAEAKVTLFWVCITIISLFLKWVDSSEGTVTWSAFSSLAGSCWYILLLLVIITSIVTLSYSKKEKIKMSMDLHFQDYNIILTSWLFIIIFSVSSLRFIDGLQTLSSGVIYGKWPIIWITWGVLIFIWGVLLRRNKIAKSGWIYMSEITEEDEEKSKENNMKLPF